MDVSALRTRYVEVEDEDGGGRSSLSPMILRTVT
jgi:hypothetical protein